jgi:hypothetical protein
MKKKMNDKLALNRETLRTLAGFDMAGVAGGGSALCTTGGSTVTDTCDTCVGPSCNAGQTTIGTSYCC